jgi:hypothetical protein
MAVRLRIVIMLLILFAQGYALYGQELFRDEFRIAGEWRNAHGKWSVTDGALVQEDGKDRITHIARIVKQDGVMEYEFECLYLGGLEDGYGVFGIHILVDKPSGRRSWGINRSYLLWITFDPRAYIRSDCFFLQVYESTGNTRMRLLHGWKGDAFPLDPGILSPTRFEQTASSGTPITFRVRIDTRNGTGRFYNPIEPGTYFPFDLETALHDGMYIAFRTNSISIAILSVAVRKLD